jgi:hypothetical protein
VTFRDADDNVLSKQDLLARTEPADPEPLYRLTDAVFEAYALPGEIGYEGARRLRYKPGTVLTASQIDGMFTTARVDTVEPGTGAAGGGETVTVHGADLGAVTLVMFGGAEATDVRITSPSTVECNTPPHPPGEVDVAVGEGTGLASRPHAFMFT